jgi:signal transduction histidine kinase
LKSPGGGCIVRRSVNDSLQQQSGAARSGIWQWINPHAKAFWVILSLGIVALVGLVDYVTPFELNFTAFYLVPVILAVWFVNWRFGIFVSALCVLVSIAGDLLTGAPYSSSLVPVWNAAILLAFYLVVLWILAKLRSLHHELEERVRQRTAALNREMQDRMRLEEQILSISEREQERIGHDLHDSLCQHLTGVALAGEVLSEQLAAQARPEAKASEHLVEMVEAAIDLTRTLARGLHPELKGEGFIDALRQLAASMSEGFKTSCRFQCDGPVDIGEEGVATHLYRLAQEAINNAVKHSHAREIVVRLETCGPGLRLTISDDGIGLPAPMPAGMGMRTMAHRASVIGAAFQVERLAPHGTRVTCQLPDERLNSEGDGDKS